MNYIQYSFIALLIITLILVIILFLKLYFKIKSSEKDSINLIQFPKETENKLENFINNSKNTHANLVEEFKKTQIYSNNLIKDIDNKISPFEKVAREKNDELKEYKKGYEYSRYKALLDGVIETIIFIENAENKISSSDEIAKSYFESTKDKLLIILNNSGIEPFTPELNIQSLDHQGCEVDINTELTNDKSKNDLIHSVVARGYKLNLKDGTVHFIKKALVKVYEFKNDNIENEKKNI
tara:strand:- start:4115 stop:4831 length:717 start_codon:yes stop_codon:yes gene_type:complete